ncbi:UNVERIFIED_ORG: hypothetical protein EDF86_1759 [Pseudomonas psychrophila]
MSTIPDVRPSTLDGIKRKAKCIGRDTKISHLAALDVSARHSGYENFHHARKAIQSGQQEHLLHSIFLSVYWHDTSTKAGAAGLEILEVQLPRPLSSFLSKRQCSYAQNLQGFFVEYSDHLEMRGNANSLERAKELLVRAALALQFIEATNLHPVTTKLQRSAMEFLSKLPSCDHMSRWVSSTGDWIALDEPYKHVNEQPCLASREVWVTANNIHLAKPDWGGLYYPSNAVPHILSNNPDLLHKIFTVVEELSENALQKDGRWAILAQKYYSQFVSPARQSASKKRKPRPGTTYGYSKNAVEYQRSAGYPSRWRPDQIMSMENHKELGGVLKRLYHSDTPYTAHVKIRELQSELEDWMFSEYRHENRDDVDFDVYYGGNNIQSYLGVSETVNAIVYVRSMLEGTYLDSKPLRDLIRKLEVARTHIVS